MIHAVTELFARSSRGEASSPEKLVKSWTRYDCFLAVVAVTGLLRLALEFYVISRDYLMDVNSLTNEWFTVLLFKTAAILVVAPALVYMGMTLVGFQLIYHPGARRGGKAT